MTSPVKLLLLTLCAAALVAYFGEKFVLAAKNMSVAQENTALNSDQDIGLLTKNRAGYGDDIHIPMSQDGHYWVVLDVNGSPVHFVVDTGASHISLRYEDAKSVGLDPDNMDFNQAFNTANGISRKAVIKLDRITLESFRLSNIPASVSEKGQLSVSLLGMNFLNELSGFKVENKVLILSP